MFYIEDLYKILDKMNVEFEKGKNENLKLEEDLYIDSQEIVELLSEIKEIKSINTKKVFLDRNDTLQDVVQKVNCLSEEYEASRTDCILMKCNIDTIKNAIWNVEKWEKLLSHIKSITILKSDKTYQKFLMEVYNDRGDLKVESNRLKLENQIYFNQPVPPQYLKVHKGVWTFTEKSNEETLIELTHQWTMSSDAVEYFSDIEPEKISEVIDYELCNHAKQTLNMWKEVLNA